MKDQDVTGCIGFLHYVLSWSGVFLSTRSMPIKETGKKIIILILKKNLHFCVVSLLQSD